MVYLMSDLDLPLRDRIYREPDGPHVAVVRGRDLDGALDHLDVRPDCRALAVLGCPKEPPDLELLSGRRLLVCDGASATCVQNEDAASGQASSLRMGLQSMPEEIAGALVMLGDQPLVGSRTVSVLLRAWRREGARPAVAASYGDRDAWQPPVLLDR